MKTRYESARKAISAAGLDLDKELVAEYDHTWSIGFLKTLGTSGLQADRDIAVVGFDDLTICQFTQPSLTAIKFSPRELAHLAFSALMEEIQQTMPKTPLNTRPTSFFGSQPALPASSPDLDLLRTA